MGLEYGQSDATPVGDSFVEEGFDNVLEAWKDTCMAGFQNEAERTVHIRSLISYKLGAEENVGGYRGYYYSFCRRCRSIAPGIAECGECRDWREWHCDRCNRYKYGVNILCEGYGGVSDSYDRIGGRECF